MVIQERNKLDLVKSTAALTVSADVSDGHPQKLLGNGYLLSVKTGEACYFLWDLNASSFSSSCITAPSGAAHSHWGLPVGAR